MPTPEISQHQRAAERQPMTLRLSHDETGHAHFEDDESGERFTLDAVVAGAKLAYEAGHLPTGSVNNSGHSGADQLPPRPRAPS